MTSNCLVAEVQLKYHPNPITKTLHSSSDIHRILIDHVFDGDTIGYKESFKILLLNNANMLIGYNTISDGGLTSTMVDVRVVMQTALVGNATSIILAHNHPSGMVTPSIQDDKITRKIKQACELLDIRLLDHIIVTPFDGYYSYSDESRL